MSQTFQAEGAAVAAAASIQVSISFPIGNVTCNANGSLVAYGLVNPSNAALQASVTQNGNPVGQCTRIQPVPPGVPAGNNWAFNCTGIPSGVSLNFKIVATDGKGNPAQDSKQFTCIG
jgi:hypothetical protein